jgi:hypothetical protein
VLLRRRKNWATTSRTKNDLVLTLEAAAAVRHRKIKRQSSKWRR